MSATHKSNIDDILKCLPQTQCGNCLYDSCKSYALAILSGNAAINRCITGGQRGVRMLADLLKIQEIPLDETLGKEKVRSVAEIDPSACSGCSICIQKCPFDAIAGTGKMMHAVLSPYCTGCEKCLAHCPLDCIAMRPVSGEKTGWDAWSESLACQARERYERKLARMEQIEEKSADAKTEPAASGTSRADYIKRLLASRRNRPASK